MIKEAEVELVNYKTDEISEASVRLITLFAKYSGIYGTHQWVGAIVHLLKIIELQQPEQLSLEAEGVGVSFSGFSNPRPLIKDGKLTYKSKEPRFVIEDRLGYILPRERTRIARATADITEEMEDVFGMTVESPPHTLIFPNRQFAKQATVFNAKLF